MTPEEQQRYEQRHAQAVSELRSAKQFVLFTFTEEPAYLEEGDVSFLLGGSDGFAAIACDMLSRYLMSQIFFPEGKQ